MLTRWPTDMTAMGDIATARTKVRRRIVLRCGTRRRRTLRFKHTCSEPIHDGDGPMALVWAWGYGDWTVWSCHGTLCRDLLINVKPKVS
jgi:hypothetical protein